MACCTAVPPSGPVVTTPATISTYFISGQPNTVFCSWGSALNQYQPSIQYLMTAGFRVKVSIQSPSLGYYYSKCYSQTSGNLSEIYGNSISNFPVPISHAYTINYELYSPCSDCSAGVPRYLKWTTTKNFIAGEVPNMGTAFYPYFENDPSACQLNTIYPCY